MLPVAPFLPGSPCPPCLPGKPSLPGLPYSPLAGDCVDTGASAGEGVGDSVDTGAFVGRGVGDCVGACVNASVAEGVGDSVDTGASVGEGVGGSVDTGAFVGRGVGDCVSLPYDNIFNKMMMIMETNNNFCFMNVKRVTSTGSTCFNIIITETRSNINREYYVVFQSVNTLFWLTKIN